MSEKVRCRVCGRWLRVKLSVKRGVGPVCWSRLERIETTNQKLDTWSLDLGKQEASI